MKYEFVEDLTSDVVFRAYGRGVKDLFENSALALFSVICQVERVSPLIRKRVEVTGDDLKDLMFNWLQELIGMVDLENIFFSKFEVKKIGEKRLVAECYGEDADPEKGGTLVKAVTYYKFDLKKTGNGYEVTVSLDI